MTEPDGGPGSLLLSNYLFFTTQCEAALAFYTACGLGQVVDITRFGDGGRAVANPAMRGKVLHARFEGPGVRFYASDNDDAEPMRGSAHILMLDSRERTETPFARLGEGGRVTTPLAVKPWGDLYGKLTDRFGVPSIPHYFMIDSDGVLTGAMLDQESDIEGKLKKLLKRAKESKPTASQVAAASAGTN